jgi:hypothetical protein
VGDAVANASSLPSFSGSRTLSTVQDRYFGDDRWRGHETDGYQLFRVAVLQRWLSTRDAAAPMANQIESTSEVCVPA